MNQLMQVPAVFTELQQAICKKGSPVQDRGNGEIHTGGIPLYFEALNLPLNSGSGVEGRF